MVNFSIILPIYNVADYLESCLDSILPALEDRDEVILSLGNSTDESSCICEQYMKRYPNVKKIQQSGKGLSNARNCAIKLAAGEYIICIDADDLIDTKLFQQLLDRIRRGEIEEQVIAHDYYRMDRRTGVKVPFFQIGEGTDCRGMAFLPQMLRQRQCFWNVWRYIYRKDFILANDITYKENFLSEDIDYTTSVFLAEPTIRFIHCPFYTYTVGRGSSLMDSPTLKRLTDTISILADSIERLQTASFSYKSLLIAQFQFEYILNMDQIYKVGRNDRAAAQAAYCSWKKTLSNSEDSIVRLVYVASSCLGIKTVAFLLHMAKRIKRLISKYRRAS